MKRFVLISVLLLGCGHGADVMRISAAVGRLICSGLGCPCASSGGLMAVPGRPIAFDVYPDGGVVAVYR